MRGSLLFVPQVPLTGHVGLVAVGLKDFGQSGDLEVEVTGVARVILHLRSLDLPHRAQSRLVVIHAGEQDGPRRRTARKNMEVRQPHPLPRQHVQGGGQDLAPEGPDIRVAHVIGDNEQDVGSIILSLRAFRGGLGSTGGLESEQRKSSHYWSSLHRRSPCTHTPTRGVDAEVTGRYGSSCGRSTR